MPRNSPQASAPRTTHGRIPLVLAGLIPLAFALACGGGGPATIDEAQAMCARKEAEGCLFLAEAFEQPGQRAAHPEAYEVYVEVSCDSGMIGACYDYGFIRLTGEGGAKDPAAAARAFEKGCDGGDGRACLTLGEQTYRGDGIPKSAKQALERFRAACDHGISQGCIQAGRLLAEGEAGTVDIEAAKALYAKACELDPSGPFCR
ncbi:MAG: sel1 repeat family protein [Alphaproteobacteria bacterium]|nr:sel1 repeat family protein [Alphaproteobacteria bacterium]